MYTQDPQLIASFLTALLLVCGVLVLAVLVLAVALRPGRRRGRHARPRRTPTGGG